MALTPEEQSIIDAVKSSGGNASDAKEAIVRFRSTDFNNTEEVPRPVSSGAEALGDIVETGKGIGDIVKSRIGKIQESIQATSFDPNQWASGQGQTPIESFGQVTAQNVLGFGDLLFEVGKGAVKTFVTTGEQEEAIAQGIAKEAEKMMQNPYVSGLVNDYNQASDRTKRNLDVPLAALEWIGLKGTSALTKESRSISHDLRLNGYIDEPPVWTYEVQPDGSVVRKGTTAADTTKATTPTGTETIKEGLLETGREIMERPGRVRERLIDNLKQAAERRAIRDTNPAAASALSVGVPEATVSMVNNADEATQLGMSAMLDIAESGARGTNVMNVPAQAAEQIFDIVDAERRSIGQQIGEVVDSLPNQAVDMRPAYREVDALLQQEGVVLDFNTGKLNFSDSGLSPKQRSLVESAYTLLHEAGDIVNAKVVHNKDSMFSALQREAYIDDIQPVLVKTTDGQTVDLLTVMRDVYRKPLDTLSDGRLRVLNTEYAKYRNLTSDLENTIFKTARSLGVQVDKQEKAARLLRRMDSNAVSAPDFMKVVSEAYSTAQKLGYSGPNIIELTYFANDIAPFLDTPNVSRPGGFFGSIKGAVSGAFEAGAANNADRIKALREMLKKIDPGTAASVIGATGAAAYLAENPEAFDEFIDGLSESDQLLAFSVIATAAASGKVPLRVLRKAAERGKTQIARLEAAQRAGKLTSTKAKELRQLKSDMKKLDKEINAKVKETEPDSPGFLDEGATPKTTGTPDPKLQTKRDVPMKDVAGNKLTVPKGTVLEPRINEKGQAIISVNGKDYTIPKNQYDNLKGQSDVAVATKFAPELEGTEVTVRGGGDLDNLDKISIEKFGKNFTSITPEQRLEVRKIMPVAQSTKYSQYTLPGGEDYREIIVQAPLTKGKEELIAQGFSIKKVAPAGYGLADTWSVLNKDGKIIQSGFRSEEDAVKGFFREAGNYRSSHWEEPNPLAHLRMNKRDWNGKHVEFMEENQSDWAKDLRIASEEKAKSEGLTGDAMKKRRNELYLQAIDGKVDLGMPVHPLLKNWQVWNTKKALMDAVDRDADIFAWINGAQTSERYKLSTHVENVKWFRRTSKRAGSEEEIMIDLIPKEARGPINIETDKKGTITFVGGSAADQSWKGKRLDEVLGKGMADSIMSKKSGTLEGEGLNFGGEWAYNLYDRQVRDIVKKLTGAEVKKADMGLGSGQKRSQIIKQDGPDAGGILTPSDIKVGREINDETFGDFIITKNLGGGRFKAVSSKFYVQFDNIIKKKGIEDLDEYFGGNQKEFDVSLDKPSTQQYIELTPEVKAKIRSEAPKFKMKNPSAGEALPLILLLLGGGTVAANQ